MEPPDVDTVRGKQLFYERAPAKGLEAQIGTKRLYEKNALSPHALVLSRNSYSFSDQPCRSSHNEFSNQSANASAQNVSTNHRRQQSRWRLAKVPSLFVIHPEVLAKDFKAFVAYVKANPGELNFGSAGNASSDAMTDGGSPAEFSALIKRE